MAMATNPTAAAANTRACCPAINAHSRRSKYMCRRKTSGVVGITVERVGNAGRRGPSLDVIEVDGVLADLSQFRRAEN